jgi:hypothetical protein
MQAILDDSFDIVAAIRLLAGRIEALEQRLAPAEEPASPAKPARPPKARGETMEVEP